MTHLFAQVPAKDARALPRDYAGPEREDVEPDVAQVLIGFFGPDDPSDPDSDLYLAARVAVDEANRAGGYRGKPFRLVARWSSSPWTAGASKVTQMIYADHVWAVIGGVDGPTTHLAEQVVAKARAPLVSPASTDKTVNYAGVPWMFSCLPSDDQAAPALGDAVLKAAGSGRFIVLSATDHDSHYTASEVLKYLERRGRPPAFYLEFTPGSRNFTAILGDATGRGVATALVVAAPADLVAATRALIQIAPSIQIVAGPAAARRAFRDSNVAGRVVFPALCNGDVPAEFARSFAAVAHQSADCATAQSYDAARLVIAAIRSGGLNRVRIRDALERLSPWTGVAGTIRWDNVGQNQRPVSIFP